MKPTKPMIYGKTQAELDKAFAAFQRKLDAAYRAIKGRPYPFRKST